MDDNAPGLELPNGMKPNNYPQKFVYPSEKNMPKMPLKG
jgi:hypothetical protein